MKYSNAMLLNKFVVLIIFVLLVLVFFPLCAKTKPIVCTEKDSWVNELPDQKKGQTYYFIGLSSGQRTVEDARNKAYKDAISVMSDSVGVTVHDYFSDNDIVYKDKGIIEREGKTDHIIEVNGFHFTIDYDKVKIVEACSDRRDDGYNAAFKIAVSEEDIRRMNVEGKAKTAWKVSTSQCNNKQIKYLEQKFMNMASKLNWNLIKKVTYEPDFSTKVPETAYFVNVEVECDSGIKIFVTHFNLIEGTIKTGSGSNYEELENVFK